MTMIRVDRDADGIATLIWDMPGRTMNVLSDASVAEFQEVVETSVTNPKVRGVVVTSGKNGFIAGADLAMVERIAASQRRPSDEEVARIYSGFMSFNRLLRRIEKSGKPFVAAINGTALGGGFEICLACHFRVAADDRRIRLGLPEAKLGLMPAAGGTQRLPRLIGIIKALPLLLQGEVLRTVGRPQCETRA